MKAFLVCGVIGVTAGLSGCGGGGDGSNSQNVPSMPVQQVTAAKTVVLDAKLEPWFHTQQSIDGNETLVVSTMDTANFRNYSPATPLMALKGGDSGAEDVTAQYFDSVPQAFWARNLLPFKDDNGNTALWICSQGRETTSPTTANGTNGIWSEQDQLFVMQNGKYINKTSTLPQRLDFTHGCAIANLGDGKRTLVKNVLNVAPYKQLLAFDGTQYSAVQNLDFPVYKSDETRGTFAAAAGDFTKTGVDDVVYGNAVIRKGSIGYTTVYTLKPPAEFVAAGYTVVHNLVVADLNGDSYPDLLVTYSGNGNVAGGPSFLSGAKLAVYINDKAGNLVLKPNAIPTQDDNEFGLSVRLIDVNFDGKADIVTSGPRYMVSNLSNNTDPTVRSILISNGDGTFTKKQIVDTLLDKQCSSNCQQQMFFLKNSDGSFNVIAYGKNAAKQNIFYSRKITAGTPLSLQ